MSEDARSRIVSPEDAEQRGKDASQDPPHDVGVASGVTDGAKRGIGFEQRVQSFLSSFLKRNNAELARGEFLREPILIVAAFEGFRADRGEFGVGLLKCLKTLRRRRFDRLQTAITLAEAIAQTLDLSLFRY